MRAGRRLLRGCLVLLVAATIGCDQASKHVAASHLPGAPRRTFLGDTIRLEYAENAGAFLSVGADLPPRARTILFTAGTGILLALCLGAAFRSEWSGLSRMGLALAAGGGISNLADRVRYGAVVDFLNVGIGPVRTGIFNVADMAILLGLAFLLIGTRASRKADRRIP